MEPKSKTSQMASGKTQKVVNKHQDFLYPELTYKIRGAIFNVRKELGPVFKETVYQKALEIDFLKQKIPFVSQKPIDIIYDNRKIGIYKPDFIIDNKIIVELKAVPNITKLEERQIWYYLKGTDYKLAFLVNFGAGRLQIKRWIYDKAREKYNKL